MLISQRRSDISSSIDCFNQKCLRLGCTEELAGQGCAHACLVVSRCRMPFQSSLRNVNLLRVTMMSLDGLSQKALLQCGQKRGLLSLRGIHTWPHLRHLRKRVFVRLLFIVNQVTCYVGSMYEQSGVVNASLRGIWTKGLFNAFGLLVGMFHGRFRHIWITSSAALAWSGSPCGSLTSTGT